MAPDPGRPVELRRVPTSSSGPTIDRLDTPTAQRTRHSRTPGEAQELAALLVAAGRGDTDAFALLVHRTTDWATAHAYALLRDRSQAQDCVQQTFLEIWQSADRYDTARGGVKGWLLVVLRRRAIDHIRAAESDRRRLERFELLTHGLDAGGDLTPELAHAHLDGYVVRAALAALPGSERELLWLSYWRGLSHSQIATEVGLPLGTVKTRLRRGLERLRVEVAPGPAGGV